MADSAQPFSLEIAGHCPICERDVTLKASHYWLRGSLNCPLCRSVPRERHLAMVLKALRPNWRDLKIHESSPADRGISKLMREQGRHYIASHYYPDQPMGSTVNGFQNENLERQTFADETFDIVVTLDVFEHLFDPAAAHREIHRTLRPGGVHVCTFPIRKAQVEPVKWRARLKADGAVEHLVADPEYHGNPISGDGALVTVDYGYDVHKQIAEWADFDVSVIRGENRRAGVLGEYTEVIVCTKR